jgi:PhnB protein
MASAGHAAGRVASTASATAGSGARGRGAQAAVARTPMTGIQPELWVERAAAAITFYEKAFGARVIHIVGEGDDIVAQLSVGDAAFWVVAASPAMNRFSPQEIGGTTSRTLLVVEDPDRVLAQATLAGAHESSPVGDEHGWRLGRIIDPFGHEWEVGKPLGRWPPTGDREPPSEEGPIGPAQGPPDTETS